MNNWKGWKRSLKGVNHTSPLVASQAQSPISSFAGTRQGIMEQIENREAISYKEDMISHFLSDNFTNRIRPNERHFKFFTGEWGMWKFNWVLMYGEAIEKASHIKQGKHMKGTYISLFQKRSNYKLLVEGTTFRFFKGTKQIQVFYDVTNEWNISKGKDITDPDVPLKIQSVNMYIDKLYKDWELENIEMEYNTTLDKLNRLVDNATDYTEDSNLT